MRCVPSPKQQHLFIDRIVNPPKDKADLGRFEAEIRTAAEVGALAVRTVIMPGRRYEQFRSLAEFKEFETRGRLMLERAAPIVTKHRVRWAVENHKDQRIDERPAIYKQLSCEFIRNGGLGRILKVDLLNYPGTLTVDTFEEEAAVAGVDFNLFCGPTARRPHHRNLWMKEDFKVGSLLWRMSTWCN